MRHSIKTKLDHIIIGQGLAGSCLALQLIRRGKRILVYDEPKKNRASAVAAGLFNPITGKMLKPAWIADKIFPHLFQFYEEAERALGEKFFYPQPIYRPFISIEEQNDWMARSEDPAAKKFINKIFTKSTMGHQTHDPFGGIITNWSGYLDANLFVEGVCRVLRKEESYCEDFFDLEKLIIGEHKILYHDIEADSVIFCDGVESRKSSLFGWIPILALKGETINVSLAEKPTMIFNRGVYIVPSKIENQYTAGATYDPNDSTETITNKGRAELEDKIKNLTKIRYTINNQNWGMRPATPDRRPVLGSHPKFKNLIIFNGLGTKGVSLAPYFSAMLADWLEQQVEIPYEVNIERFKSLYSKFSFAKL